MGFDPKANSDELKQLQYDPLRDPTLLAYLSKPRTLRRLIRLGLVSRDGRVKTSYKVLTDYRTKYLHRLAILLAQKKVGIFKNFVHMQRTRKQRRFRFIFWRSLLTHSID